MADQPLGQRNYEQFARRYAELARSKPHNAFLERPATLSLLPDLRGRRVLDAGCGPGHYAAELVARGATVVAVDVTPDMVQLARAELGAGATVLCADLEQPLDFAADGEFDVVVCPLMLDYVEDWEGIFREFHRVLRPGGRLIYSHGHPMMEFRIVRERCDPDSVYYDVELYALAWRGFGEPRPLVRSFRRPLAAMINPLVAAGFELETLLEPRPTEAFRDADPEGYAHLMREPAFLCVRARKPVSPS